MISRESAGKLHSERITFKDWCSSCKVVKWKPESSEVLSHGGDKAQKINGNAWRVNKPRGFEFPNQRERTGNSRRIIELSHTYPQQPPFFSTSSLMPPKTLTLKQRLAALTQSPTSPAPQYGPEPSTPRSPGKRRFSAPWRRGSIQDGYGMQSEEDKLQEVMGRMIYQAGVDYECVVFLLLMVKSFANTEGNWGVG